MKKLIKLLSLLILFIIVTVPLKSNLYKCAIYWEDVPRSGYKEVTEHYDWDPPTIECSLPGIASCEFSYNPCEELYFDQTWTPLDAYARNQVANGNLTGVYHRPVPPTSNLDNWVTWDYTISGHCTIKEEILKIQ